MWSGARSLTIADSVGASAVSARPNTTMVVMNPTSASHPLPVDGDREQIVI